MNIDIQETRRFLRNACATTEGVDRVQRKAFGMLINEIRALREAGFTFIQISEMLKTRGFALDASTAKNYFYEILVTLHEDIVRQMDEHLDECLNNLAQLSVPKELEGKARRSMAASPVHEIRCLPLDSCIKPLARREGVPEEVYCEGLMEHPAIAGLMLSLEERLYGALLDIVENGQARTETVHEKAFRIKWKKPIPITPSATAADFVEMDNELFKYVGKPKPPGWENPE